MQSRVTARASDRDIPTLIVGVALYHSNERLEVNMSLELKTLCICPEVLRNLLAGHKRGIF
jgi:hypothetical protein